MAQANNRRGSNVSSSALSTTSTTAYGYVPARRKPSGSFGSGGSLSRLGLRPLTPLVRQELSSGALAQQYGPPSHAPPPLNISTGSITPKYAGSHRGSMTNSPIDMIPSPLSRRPSSSAAVALVHARAASITAGSMPTATVGVRPRSQGLQTDPKRKYSMPTATAGGLPYESPMASPVSGRSRRASEIRLEAQERSTREPTTLHRGSSVDKRPSTGRLSFAAEARPSLAGLGTFSDEASSVNRDHPAAHEDAEDPLDRIRADASTLIVSMKALLGVQKDNEGGKTLGSLLCSFGSLDKVKEELKGGIESSFGITAADRFAAQSLSTAAECPTWNLPT